MMLTAPTIEIAENPSRLAERAAEEFLRLRGETLRTGRRFAVALAGGATPQQMYTHLSKVQTDWEHVHFFWGDERCVPPEAAESNYRTANEALLSHIPIPTENVHRIRGEQPAAEAAQEYEDDLRVFFGEDSPRFDLVLLGLGGDGHTASLFPKSPALREKRRWAVAVSHHTPPPQVERVTLTLPVLNAAAHVLFLVSGAEKTERLAEVLQGRTGRDLLPAQRVKPVNGSMLWLVDKAAAAKISMQQH